MTDWAFTVIPFLFQHLGYRAVAAFAFLSIFPVNSKILSESVDLPWSTWAIIEKFLTFSIGIKGIFETSNPADLIFIVIGFRGGKVTLSYQEKDGMLGVDRRIHFFEKRTWLKKLLLILHLWAEPDTMRFPIAREETRTFLNMTWFNRL